MGVFDPAGRGEVVRQSGAWDYQSAGDLISNPLGLVIPFLIAASRHEFTACS